MDRAVGRDDEEGGGGVREQIAPQLPGCGTFDDRGAIQPVATRNLRKGSDSGPFQALDT